MRRRAPLEELGGRKTPAVVDALAEPRLVTGGDGPADVAHEALLLPGHGCATGWTRNLFADLVRHRAADRRRRRMGRRLGRDPDLLYRGARLASALDWERATTSRT